MDHSCLVLVEGQSSFREPGTEPGLDKLTGASTVTATRYYSHGGTVAARTTVGLSWLAADHQASTNLTVNATTGAVQRRWYTPYGADRATQGVWPTDRGFLNKQNNTSTGLIDVGAREYDPNLGSFISPDPLLNLADPRHFNAYAYSVHSPITHSDPTGLFQSMDGGTSWSGFKGSAWAPSRQESGSGGASGGGPSGTLTIPYWDAALLAVGAWLTSSHSDSHGKFSNYNKKVQIGTGASGRSASDNDADAARAQALGDAQKEQLDELRKVKAGHNVTADPEPKAEIPPPPPPPTKPPVATPAGDDDDGFEDFLHATHRPNADALMNDGFIHEKFIANLNGSHSPGSFYTVGITQAGGFPSAGELAASFLRLNPGVERVVVVLRIPNRLLAQLWDKGLMSTGTGAMPETYFTPGSDPILNQALKDGVVRWVYTGSLG